MQEVLEELALDIGAVQTVERIYAPAAFAAYTHSAAVGWNLLPNPLISIPALGTPPAGTGWRVDVLGGLRAGPPTAGTLLSGVAFNATASEPSVTAGGGYHDTYPHPAMPVIAPGLVPPADLASPFDVRLYFHTGSAGAGSYSVEQAPRLRARVYLVKV